jgi:glycyl-tRNA synthetase beta chain
VGGHAHGGASLAERFRAAQCIQRRERVEEAVGIDRAHRLAGKSDEAAAQIDRALLVEDAEKDLAAGLARVAVEANGDLAASLESGAQLAPLMERFFDEVLVMDEDAAVRANRLRLLLDVRDTLGALGDFSQIPR